MLAISPLLLLVFTSLLNFVIADVTIYSPAKGKTFKASGGSVTIPLKWIDDGNYPPLKKVEYYTFSLCYGPNSDVKCYYTIGKQVTPDDITVTKGTEGNLYSYDSIIPAAAVGNGQFYIQVYAVVKGEGDTIHYSPRFALSGMTGPISTFTYTYSTQPNAITEINTGPATTVASIDSKSFSIAYTLQTGSSRFAPMQMQPGSKITATTWTRKFPTSKVTYYSTYRKSLDQLTTITPGISYIMTSDINYAFCKWWLV
ncbi:Cell wall synthesis protein kre9 precursor [Monosporozyma unispora]|nr:Cell wall synthesis protein kre9 precursor [Kazachstania unispora]